MARPTSSSRAMNSMQVEVNDELRESRRLLASSLTTWFNQPTQIEGAHELTARLNVSEPVA